MRVAVIGGNGQLGSDVASAFSAEGHEVFRLMHADVEVADLDSVRKCMDRLQSQLIVNTSAMHHVENCERDPANALAVNAAGPRNLALVARDTGAVLMHVSTDYVFDGHKRTPYLEDDAALPLNVYGCSKLAGEHLVRSTTERHFILRTSAIYGHSPCRAKGGLNFVELMLKLARERGSVRVVDSEFVSPTSTVELARQMVVLSATDHYGLYHATAEGSCSWFEFAQEIFSMTNTKVALSAAGAGEFAAKVARPQYSVLENGRLKLHGLNVFDSWQNALRNYLGTRAERSSAHAIA